MKKFPDCPAFSAVLVLSLLCGPSLSAAVTMEVLNPRSEIKPPPAMGINPRVADTRDWYPEVVKEFDTFIFGVAD